MKNLAVIPARGGSKRIPGKNIKNFCGKPIIAYSIEAAINSGIFDEVMVSTDSQEIADVAERFGAKVPFMRSEKTSNDYAIIADVLSEVLETYRENGQNFDTCCCIYSTAPFVTSEKLQAAYKAFQESSAKSILSAALYSYPPQRGFFIRDGKLLYVQPEYMNTRSQDIEKIYHDCGQFIMLDVPCFMSEKKIITDNTVPFIIDDIEVQDIDTIDDWKIAELKYNILHQIHKGE